MSIEEAQRETSAVKAMLEAIEAGDMERLRRCFAPNARFWHSHDRLEQNIDEVLQLLGAFCAASTVRSYEDRRSTSVGAEAFLRHTLTATLHSGRRVEIPTMMCVQLGPDGLVQRIDEYFDSRALDPVFAEIG
jgi:ketosteroid isomerase-like protein